MSEREALAALLHEFQIGCQFRIVNTSEACVEVPEAHDEHAASLLAAGVRVAPSPDAPGPTEHVCMDCGAIDACECGACGGNIVREDSAALPPRDALDEYVPQRDEAGYRDAEQAAQSREPTP